MCIFAGFCIVANKNLLGKIEEIIIDVTYKEGANDYIYYIYKLLEQKQEWWLTG